MRNPFAQLADWVDHRTGYRHLMREALYENIPSGSRWRYVTGSMLAFAFATQVITGLALWMCYSPSSFTAWESVYYIQNVMVGGWLLRGIHHFMAQAMVVLLPLHMLQVIVDRAYTPPREFNYWCGLILMLLVLGLGLTGYLLPWDQKGYSATKVATNLMVLAPQGEAQQTLVVGGIDYGHATLTRFFALHAGVLPILLAVFLVVHVALFRRHGIKTRAKTFCDWLGPKLGLWVLVGVFRRHGTKERLEARLNAQRPDQHFWPSQVFKDTFACMLLLAVVLLCVVNWDYRVITGNLPAEHRGAELAAPANPAEQYGAARPEWYFLFLFQLLKKFESEWVGAIVVPAAIMAFLFIMPFLGRWKVGHIFCVSVFVLLLLGAGYLTVEALHEDYFARIYADPATKESPSETYVQRWEKSADYLKAVEQGEADARRIKELAAYYGIPREGALALPERDPERQGPLLFAKHCASCHSHLDAEGNGIPVKGEPTAANLYGIGTPEWFRRVLDPKQWTADDMFGRTSHKEGDMYYAIDDRFSQVDDEKRQARDQLITALSAEAHLVSRRIADAKAREDGDIAKGKELLVDTFTCTECHKFYENDPMYGAPDLTGVYSAEWLRGFISDPSHTRFYGDNNDRMPAFGKDDLLTDHERDMLVRWLRGDDRDLALKFAPIPFAEEKPKPAEASDKTQPNGGDNGEPPADKSDSAKTNDDKSDGNDATEP